MEITTETQLAVCVFDWSWASGTEWAPSVQRIHPGEWCPETIVVGTLTPDALRVFTQIAEGMNTDILNAMRSTMFHPDDTEGMGEIELAAHARMMAYRWFNLPPLPPRAT